MDSPDFAGKIARSDFLWIVELYRTGCGYCAELAPEYEKLAIKLKRVCARVSPCGRQLQLHCVAARAVSCRRGEARKERTQSPTLT